MYELRRKLERELEEITAKNKLSNVDIEMADRITDAIKNIDKIKLLNEGEDDEGYSAARRGMRRGEHYVRAHYSRDGGWDDGDYSGRRSRRDGRGRYSGADGREEMLDHLSAAMESSSAEDKEAIRRLMDKLGRGL